MARGAASTCGARGCSPAGRGGVGRRGRHAGTGKGRQFQRRDDASDGKGAANQHTSPTYSPYLRCTSAPGHYLVRGAQRAPLGVQCAQAADAQCCAAAAAAHAAADSTATPDMTATRIDNRAYAGGAPTEPLAAVERRVLPGPRLAREVQQHWRHATHGFRLGVLR
eukprot:scaffold25003_cov57-Phaeocystis_antarctica.AAC.2